MKPPDLLKIEDSAPRVIDGVGRESVEVYRYLIKTFDEAPISGNHLFQFVYRCFYRLEQGGLTPEFKSRYFELMDRARNRTDIDLRELASELYKFPTLRGLEALEFSFVTKLAHTADRECPIYDSEIANAWDFKAPGSDKLLNKRLDVYMAFHGELRRYYSEIAKDNLLPEARQRFRALYDPSQTLSEVKVLDFIFWSASKIGAL